MLRRVRLAVVVSALSVAPAVAAAPGTYVALGDSYASGVGAGPYISGSGSCLRSSRSYPYRLGRRVAAQRACAGATTGDVLARQLKPFGGATRLVTITIGGNDAGFIDVIQACLTARYAGCDARVDQADRFIRSSLASRLARVYMAIRRRSAGARIVVAGYPRLFAASACRAAGGIDARKQARLNQSADLLARTIAAEVRRHPGVRFVDVRNAFRGHGICSRAPWILGLSDPLFASFHPNAAGFAAYARAIKRTLS